jgi:hypothetical protein
MTGAAKSPRGVLLRVAAGMSLLAFLWYYNPAAKPAFQLCGFHWLTGRPCPLCGLTRAMFALAKGHWSEAVSFNALSPLAFAMVAGSFWNGGPMRGRLWTCGVAAFAIYGVCRVFLPVA